ncbi:hypothetical protein QBC33DRAFT_596123 [Phialemonium atrogriseum]|uniref:Heterokaryon incompatibility domain-containing protein n=1 Tax=Phialemonium atrogriseum TaxID=1093897 RepID=A0AAJ0FIA8_9PEZI|nr:uncharacterized protein QBC33DRAFT_596123 [Phialemonium atrogriseum]KAK1764188.1 hypothetical protein QBC33DRAFT_596123 [Phialemonium atrogriseum]
MVEFRGDADHGRVFTLGEALSSCVAFGCQNPRDRIYALANVLEERPLAPDYAVEPAVLYIRTMRDVLERAGSSLDLMAFAGTGYGGEPVVGGLPSWVSEWNRHRPPRAYDSYSAGSHHRPVVRFCDSDPTTITVEGWDLDDRLEHLTEPLEVGAGTDPVGSNDIQRSWYAVAETMAVRHATPYGEQSPRESFVRTLLGDRISVPARPPTTEECQKKYSSLKEYSYLFKWAHPLQPQRAGLIRRFLTACWMDLTIDPTEQLLIQQRIRQSESMGENFSFSKSEHPALLQRFYQVSATKAEFLYFCQVYGRRFIVTERGRMAVVPPHAKKGDVICIMKGARMPFILRRKKVAGGVSERFELVGACYVHGLMDGGNANEPEKEFTLI